ncbi:hypothetical protein G9A89_009934 [Geosiphon pyriformis]|nr:hypothetical protein G9A89_009934 [Geosiphon pyriformis]
MAYISIAKLKKFTSKEDDTQQPIYQPPVYQALLYQPAAPVIYQLQPQNYGSGVQKLETNQKSLTSNIPLVTIMKNELLTAIFPFEIEEPLATPLFNGAVLKKKPITTIYINTKVNGHTIKLIINSCQVDYAASAKIIMADGVTKTSIDEINNFLFKVNSIITLIKVLVIETMQYQALVGNDWLVKTNAMLDWNM